MSEPLWMYYDRYDRMKDAKDVANALRLNHPEWNVRVVLLREREYSKMPYAIQYQRKDDKPVMLSDVPPGFTDVTLSDFTRIEWEGTRDQ